MASAEVGTPTADENDDNWLYGDSIHDQAENKEEEKSQEPPAPGTAPEEDEEKETEENDAVNDDEHFEDAANGDVDNQDNGDSDSDDSDDVKVTIGDIKSVPQSYAIKRAPGLVTGAIEKPRVITTTGGAKVNMEDLEGPGSINGVPAVEYSIDTIEDKPWKKPGADISDYFNYGFNEVTWSAYCDRQRRMRMNESGVGIHVNTMSSRQPDIRSRTAQIRNEEQMHHQPPPLMHQYQQQQPQENTNIISVMTADRREYGRRDMQPEYFNNPHEQYYNGPPPAHTHYDNAWGQPPPSNWAPSDIKELTPGPGHLGPPMGMNPPVNSHMSAPHMVPPPYSAPFRHGSSHGDRDRDRDRERDRTREREERDRRDRERDRDRDRHDDERERDRDRQRSVKPDRSREKSYRRERSRSHSRRHKSRSRSPRQRDRERSTKPKSKDSKDKEDDK